MIPALKLAGVTAADTVYDLGCGDGRIVISAAKDHGAKGVGVDINPERIQEARENAKKANVEDKVRFEENDLFKADIAKASVVTLYLLPDVNQRLRPKLLKELKPRSRIVSHSFDMGDWKPQREEVLGGRHLYLWTVPATPATTEKAGRTKIARRAKRRHMRHRRETRRRSTIPAFEHQRDPAPA